MDGNEQRVRAAREARVQLEVGAVNLRHSFAATHALVTELDGAIIFAIECGEQAESEAMEAVGVALARLMQGLHDHARLCTSWANGVCLGYREGEGT